MDAKQGNIANPSPTGVSQLDGADTEGLPSVRPSVEVTATPGQPEDVKYNGKSIKIEYYDLVQQKQVETSYEIQGDEKSPEVAMEAVNKAYLEGVLGTSGIKTNSVIYSDGNIFIDFTSDIYEISLGSEGEIALLDSIADAYLNNIDAAKAVFFTVDGKGYASGHIEIKKNEAYKVKE
ncbi:MAG: GerMN domain-containing protein [Christensenella sp.]|uniref:GerMN domain-containing protein n=1 Tax=Christensenella sp. TaxID=1935934 RepID=UPI002B21F6C8|nr:GerMN domain-containing protein [Christensenella sp.]MEA5003745.1 GerMN domain-containing protein [Christensenella sp.]